LFSAVRASSAAGHGHEHHPSELEIVRENRATLNDIPIPEGSWQENYNKRNAKWNKILGASLVCFAITSYAVCIPALLLMNTVKSSVVQNIQFNYFSNKK